MKKLLALVLACSLSSVVHAAVPTAESIERLLALMQAEKLLEGLRPQIDGVMKTSMEQALQGKPVTPAEQAILDNFRSKAVAIVQSELTMAKLKPMYIDIYAKNFTQEEVDGLIAFYETPVGQAYVAKMPAVMQMIMAEMPQRLNPMMRQMQKAADDMKKELADLKKKQGR